MFFCFVIFAKPPKTPFLEVGKDAENKALAREMGSLYSLLVFNHIWAFVFAIYEPDSWLNGIIFFANRVCKDKESY